MSYMAFAILAVGKSNTMDMDFYADLRAQHVTSLQKPDIQTPAITTNDTLTDDLTLPLQDSDKENSPTPPEDRLSTFRLALKELVQDMLERVKEGDRNYISGLRKYIAAYKAMQRSHAPTASIAYQTMIFQHSPTFVFLYWRWVNLITGNTEVYDFP